MATSEDDEPTTPELPEERLEESQPQCPFGVGGSCCRICYMGPCRVSDGAHGMERGVCGATPGTVAARNVYREIASGAASHADHAREIATVLAEIADGELSAYDIADPEKLRTIAADLGLDAEGDVSAVAEQVAEAAIEDFQEGGETLNWLDRMPDEQREYLAKQGIEPLPSADKEVARAMHRTTQGNDADPKHLLTGAVEAGLTDGYAGLTMGTDLQDVVFGTPQPVQTEADLGTLREDAVNIAVHGHSPVLSEMVVKHANELEDEAIEAGADGINIVGICCTGNELAERQKVPLAAHSSQAELAVTTGALDAMVADIQCIWPGIGDVVECHHTRLITTVDYVRIPGAEHVSFDPETAAEDAEEIVRRGIAAFGDRHSRQDYTVEIPDRTTDAMVGVSDDFVLNVLESANPENPSRPLVDAMEAGDLNGIVGIVGCPNPKMRTADMTEILIEELLAENVLPVVTGCIGHITAQNGYLDPAMTDELAGDGLAAVLNDLGEAAGLDGPLPPVWHMGSCVDNSRIGNVVRAISEDAGVPTRELPVVASAPELIAEKAVSIGTWALALGLPLHTAPTLHMDHSEEVTRIMTEDLKDITGGFAIQEEDPKAAADAIASALDDRRTALFEEA
ncbi:anaerobic carbon-monoxide dehydrogenase catalytic subunit [Halorubrum sp. CSM-61]|uniref:anaerobic carbon-monoxide dehydrogenase catalytic subunit n=1 Tax=Halorubrum sp. CSM-61 TaxID=2485838 RepID=UPI000F4BE2C8|nr:anaerobic carbon-monoxide dehydrogenase catalytic subunit [Halorubrum sp. CSM-61]